MCLKIHQQSNFPTLTRMLGGYDDVAIVIRGILKSFNWNQVALLYHNHGETKGKGHSACYFSLGAVYRNVKNNNDNYQRGFDETQPIDFKSILEEMKGHARSELHGFNYI